jgi:DsbC/DsbD-like thiol-disulfide interchange protein
MSGLLTGLAVAAVMCAQPPADEARAKARLVSEQTALVPGSTAWIGLTFDIDSGWHLYWNGVNDTGLPIHMEPGAPAGYTWGEPLWPAPVRHLTDDFLDHIYEKRVTLLLPLTVPAEAGGKVTLTMKSSWLVCKTACLPGDAELSLTLPVAKEATPSPDARLFAEARERIPQPLKNDVKLEWSTEGVRVKGPAGAKSISFYPGQKCSEIKELSSSGAAKADTLPLAFVKPGPADRLVGVLEVHPQQGARSIVYSVDHPRPGTNPAGSGASDPERP